MVRFSESDIRLFSQASFDSNPLHLSESYARKTSFGNPVVFGILGLLSCLGQLKDRPGRRIKKLDVRFKEPLFKEIPYTLNVAEKDDDGTTLKLYDGKRQMLVAKLEFEPGTINNLRTSGNPRGSASRSVPADLNTSGLQPGTKAEGRHLPRWEALLELERLFGLQNKGFGREHLAALLWSSYCVGMELPGLRALYSRLSIQFENLDTDEPLDALTYKAQIQSHDDRYGLLQLHADLMSNQSTFASARLEAFLREDVSSVWPSGLGTPSQSLRGQVAFVTGASRGLGASYVQALAWRGCTVFVNFLKSKIDAEQLAQSLIDCPGKVILSQGDASDSAYCKRVAEEIQNTFGRLDYLVCNACPPLLPYWLDLDSIHRINDYVANSLALTTVPLAAFLPLVDRSKGWALLISSAAVENPPPEWLHYVAAKSAAESIFRTVEKQFTNARFLVSRPPALRTELCNTPMGRQNAESPAKIAINTVNLMNAEA